MILAAHQPCYLPKLSFFYKMAQADVFVLTDDFQYTTHNFINRSQIKTVRGAAWLTVPVLTKGHRSESIRETLIDSSQNWQRKHWRALSVNYACSAYFEQYADFFEEIYLSRKWKYLVDLNLKLIEFAKKMLNLSTKIVLSSDLNLKENGSILLAKMSTAFNCTTYLAERKFENYLDRKLFSEKEIELNFFSYKSPKYYQLFGDFASGLSIVDIIFNEGMDSRELITKCKNDIDGR